MTIRWMEGTGRLDTSRGSRFMRGEADLDPIEAANKLNLRLPTPTADGAAKPQAEEAKLAAEERPLEERTKPAERRRQVRASLHPAGGRRTAG